MSEAQNNRVYYAVHAVGLAENGTSGYKAASGVQNVGLNTTFNLEQIFQLGQLSDYEQVENAPDVEVTIEKVLDGAPLVQHLATPAATSPTLAGRYNNNKSNIVLNYYNDANDNASGDPKSQVLCSGMFVSAITMTLPVDGNFTEAVTFVGNNKLWATGTSLGSGQYGFAPGWEGQVAPLGADLQPDSYNDNAAPPAVSGVQRRENLIMSGCKWPLDIYGISSSGSNNLHTDGDKFLVHAQSVTISTDLGRTELFELGRKGPYHRFSDFPTEVTCAIEITETEFGDQVQALEDVNNVVNREIYFVTTDGTQINLGTKNRLGSTTSSGGDTGGGNRTTTYNYSNFNILKITNIETDPAGQDA